MAVRVLNSMCSLHNLHQLVLLYFVKKFYVKLFCNANSLICSFSRLPTLQISCLRKKDLYNKSILINLMTNSRKSVSRRFDRLKVNYASLEKDAQYFGRTPSSSGLGVLQTPNNFKRIWDPNGDYY